MKYSERASQSGKPKIAKKPAVRRASLGGRLAGAKRVTLSIVIPVYNEEFHLKACLDAIAAQLELPDEVIVVDNNSTDTTAAIAASYPFVKLLHARKQGVLAARTKGFNAAKSDIIGRIDADTILPIDWVSYVKQSLQDSTASAVTGPVNYYDMPFPSTNFKFDHFMRSSIYNWSPKSPFLFGSNMAIKRSAWLNVRSHLCADSYMHEDLDLAIHLDKQGQKICYDKTLLAGASGRRYNDQFQRFYIYLSMYRQTYLRHNIHCLAIYSATGVYWLGYFLVHPWRSSWYKLNAWLNPMTVATRQSRKNPMNSL
jgi:glycosyltransferase involved in cell wall biosynthesis